MARTFVLPMALVLLLLVVLVLFLMKNGMVYSWATKEPFVGEGAPTLELRAEQVVQATQDTLKDRKVNLWDEHVVYSVWSGHMSKRGLPPIYVTPEVYGGIRGLRQHGSGSDGIDTARIRDVLAPAFKKEQEWIAYQQHIRKNWTPLYHGSY